MAAKQRTSRRKNQEATTLQFRGVNDLAFVGQKCHASVFLMRGSKMITGVHCKLEVRLLYEDETRASDSTICLESKRIHITNPKYHGQICYSFTQSSLFHDNRKFRLQVCPVGKFDALEPAVSEPISVIKFKLEISNALPQQFFKDQGGRDKHMHLNVRLSDAVGNTVALPEGLPLVTRLCYEKDNRVVPDQENILKFLNKSAPKIGKNGEATISFRIEEVSSRHNRQNFKLHVAPDVHRCPLNGDILGAYSSSVTVRSKQTAPTNRKRSRAMQRAIQYPQPGVSPLLGKSMDDALAESKRIRLDTSNSMQAVQDLIAWSTSTRDMLESLKSQHVGYELQSDGSPDLAMKIHRCPSCYQSSSCLQKNKHARDCSLNKVLKLYKTRVAPGIAYILKAMAEGVPQFEKAPQNHNVVESHNMDLEPPVYYDTSAPRSAPHVPPPQPIVERYLSAEGLCLMFNGVQSPLADCFSPTCFADGEDTICYVIKKHANNGATNLGFPAFDKDRQLKGFFQDTPHALGNSVEFFSLSELNVQPIRVQELQQDLEKLSLSPTHKGMVKCLHDYKDVTDMKRDIEIDIGRGTK